MSGAASKPQTVANDKAPLGQAADSVVHLAEVLREETQQLQSGQFEDLHTATLRKQLMLMQLSAFCIDSTKASSLTGFEQLRVLKEQLTENCLAHERQIRALQEIHTLLLECHRDAESDGTYSPMVRRGMSW